MRAFFILSLVACYLLLTSCGFRLRGAVTLPPQLERTELAGIDPRSALGDEIRAVLEGAGARIVMGDATALLHVGDEGEARRVLTVGGSTGQASEYEIIYQFSFELRAPLALDAAEDAEPAILVPRQTVSVSRDYAFDPTNVVAKAEEEAMLVREMRTFAVRQMVLRLRAGLQSAKP